MTPVVAWTLVRLAAIGALLLGGLLTAPAERAAANGVPTPVDLSYIDLSNWGPEDATGVAELIFAEGIVRLTAEGLPRLDGERYQGWLVNSEVGDAISVGRFNASPDGDVDYRGTLPPISDFGFDLFILTVEPEPDDAPTPSSNRSIGGYFSLVGQPGPDGSIEGAPAAAPSELPNTGGGWMTGDLARLGMLGGIMALSLVVGVRLGRRTA